MVQEKKENVTKQSLALKLHDKIGMSCSMCNDIISDLFTSLADSLKQGKGLKIRNFGSFQIKSKNSRPGVNLNTGEQIVIPARKAVQFTMSRTLKKKLNNIK